MGAIVDIGTGKIIGAEENTLAWFHEKGHIEYNNSELGIRNGYRRQWVFDFMLLFIIVAEIFWLFVFVALILFLSYMAFAMYEEVWCWRYAQDKFKEFKNQNQEVKKHGRSNHHD